MSESTHPANSNSHYASSFRELYVYKEARELAKAIYKVSLAFPAEEKYSLTDQISL